MRAHLGKKFVFLTNTHWFYAYFSTVFSRIVMVILSQVGDLRNKAVCLPLAYVSSLKSSSFPSTLRSDTSFLLFYLLLLIYTISTNPIKSAFVAVNI